MDPVIGDKLWRPVQDGEVVDPDFGERNDRGQLILRAQELGNIWVAVPNGNPGMVCFCREEIPEGWTFMMVVAVSKKTLFVEPRVGSQKDLLDAHS